MQQNTFTCSKCHNNYPIQSKVMHELHCTKPSNVPHHQIPPQRPVYHPQHQINININAHMPYQSQPQNFSQAQKCPKCGIEFPQNEMSDHLLVHQLDEENNIPENAPHEQNEASPLNLSNIDFNDVHSSFSHNPLFSRMINNLRNLENLIEQMNQPPQHPVPDAIVNELPEITIDSVDKLDGDKKNCTICLDSFKHRDKALILPCIHIFHTDCIKNWFKTQNTCPICKFKMDVNSLNN